MICLLMLSVTAAAAQDENRRLTVSGQLVDADLIMLGDTEGRYDQKWGNRDQRR